MESKGQNTKLTEGWGGKNAPLFDRKNQSDMLIFGVVGFVPLAGSAGTRATSK